MITDRETLFGLARMTAKALSGRNFSKLNYDLQKVVRELERMGYLNPVDVFTGKVGSMTKS